MIDTITRRLGNHVLVDRWQCISRITISESVSIDVNCMSDKKINRHTDYFVLSCVMVLVPLSHNSRFVML